VPLSAAVCHGLSSALLYEPVSVATLSVRVAIREPTAKRWLHQRQWSQGPEISVGFVSALKGCN
jgi:hypothetical protein